MVEKLPDVIDFSSKYDFEKIKKIAQKKWRHDLSNITPSFFPELKKEYGLVVFRPKWRHDPHISACRNMIIEKKLFFPNIFGLVILEEQDKIHDLINEWTWVIGLEKEDCFQQNLGPIVPYLAKEKKGIYGYGFFPAGMILESNEAFFAFQGI